MATSPAEIHIKLTSTYEVPNGLVKGYIFEINGFTIHREQWHQFGNHGSEMFLPVPTPRGERMVIDTEVMFGRDLDDELEDVVADYESWLANELLQAKINDLMAAARSAALGRTAALRISA